ncbi:MAG: hydroxymyristoyl-ACP dehydratase [Flammeovirgaceae bacterium]|nr:hydroxymyristoyl-ACP dehydratase [Flammeovirgaceae bacterium]|tara:strand:- start:201 stop:668 length:468 start_codon:yes stop_codon:yes gene_type:complete
MSKLLEEIIALLPYRAPFLFVDALEEITENGSKGYYQLKKDEYFYQGHFPNNPITPGVILIEIMAQIGLVCFGIYLSKTKLKNQETSFVPIFTSAEVDFLGPVYPEDQLEITSRKIYYRFDKLKCLVTCRNIITNQVVCKGEFSGMIVNKDKIDQ